MLKKLCLSLTFFLSLASAKTLEGQLTKLQWEKISQSKVVMAKIPKSKPLIKLKNLKGFKTPKELKALVFQAPDAQGYYYLISREKGRKNPRRTVKFKIWKDDLTFISSQDVSLQRKPLYYDPVVL